MTDYIYKATETGQLYEPSEEEYKKRFNVSEEERDNFAYLKGTAVSRFVNDKAIRFTEKALRQAEREFKDRPYRVEHVKGLPGMMGFIRSMELDDDGLRYFSVIPKTKQNEHYLALMANDKTGIIRASIGGRSNSITCNICGKEIRHDSEHQLGRKYGGQLAFGNVNEWRTEEVSATTDPADKNTSTRMYGAGFNLSEELEIDEEPNKSDNLLNEDDNNISELTMTEHELENQEGEEASETKMTQSTPQVDTSQFVSKEEYDRLFSLVKGLADDREAEKEARLKGKRLQLSELTGEDEDEYVNLSETAIDKMIKTVSKFKKDVPGELGEVEDSGDRHVKQSVTPDMKKEAIRIILGADKPSQAVQEQYSMYQRGHMKSIYDRVDHELRMEFSEDAEDGDD